MIFSARRLFNLATRVYGGALRNLSPNGASPAPLFVSCLVTHECNMDCPFCLARYGRLSSAGPSLGAAQWMEIFRQAPSVTLLGFSGGEPFCHPQIWEIWEAAAQSHRISLISNGLSFDDSAAERLAVLGARSFFGKGLLQIGISVNEPLEDEQACRTVLAEKLVIFERLARRRRLLGKGFPVLELKVVIRDETAPHLAIFAGALENPNVDAVTFQMLNNQRFALYLGLDLDHCPAVESLRNYKDVAPEPIAFTRIEALRESFSRLAALPRAMRNRIGFLPDVPPEPFFAHYEGRTNLADFRCANPWMHVLIDPGGVAYQCFNPEGEDLKTTPFRKAWNSPNFRAFRRELRKRSVFPCCSGCCFLSVK